MILCFAAETALAGFHVGVEQHWWEGLSSCSAQLDASDIEALRQQILNGPKARCDDVAWSMFRISMAGYNFVLALGLTGFCLRALLKKKI
jgi:disulfide bond formation protein DsbB